jgi:hypothetical protein
MMYLRFTPEFGSWYSSSSILYLCGYSDADFARCRLDRKSTSRTCLFWALRWFPGLLANSLALPSLPQKLSMSLLLAVARSFFG